MTQLTSLKVTSSISTTENLAEYGLDQPAYTITVNVNDGGQLLAQVGSATATSSGYYVLVPGGVPQIVAKYGLDAVLKLLTNPPIATPTATPTVVITATSDRSYKRLRLGSARARFVSRFPAILSHAERSTDRKLRLFLRGSSQIVPLELNR